MYDNLIWDIEKISVLRRLLVRRMGESNVKWKNNIPILKYIEDNPNCNQHDIARAFHVTPASIATITKKLQQNGYITKKIDEDNQRCKNLELTEKGKEYNERIKKEIIQFDNELLSVLTPEEIDVFKTCLKKIERRLAEYVNITELENECSSMNEIIRKFKNID